MPVNTWDIIDESDLKSEIVVAPEATEQDSLLTSICGYTTAIIERRCNRHFIMRTPGSDYVEYHTFLKPRDNFWTLEAPIISITDLHESLDRDYDSADLLTSNTDYVAEKRYGRIWRVSGANPMYWQLGVRVIQLKYKAGYADRPSLPAELRKVAAQFGAFMYREVQEKMQGFSNRRDMTGYIGKFAELKSSGVFLTDHMMSALTPWRRQPSATGTNDDLTP